MSNHRTPPLPEWYHDNNPGICRWCGGEIFHLRGPHKGEPNFKLWHNRCVTEYQFLFWPATTRRVIFKERGGICEDCGKPLVLSEDRWRAGVNDARAELHHAVSLIEYQHDPLDPYAAWSRGNLVLLCHACHMVRHHGVKVQQPEQQSFLEVSK